MDDFLFGALIGIGSFYISQLGFEVYKMLRSMAKNNKPTEPLLTKEQEKQLDLMATIAFSVYHMRHKLSTEYAKRMPPEAIQIEGAILAQAESIAGLTGKCYVKSKVRALLSFDKFNNPTKDDDSK